MQYLEHNSFKMSEHMPISPFEHQVTIFQMCALKNETQKSARSKWVPGPRNFEINQHRGTHLGNYGSLKNNSDRGKRPHFNVS